MELKDWTREFVRARNAMRKTLVSSSENGEELTFEHKHKTHHFLVAPKLEVAEPRDWYSIVCLQTRENVDFLVANWDAFCVSKLSIFFVNPKENLYWHISPKLHSSIADPKNLALGIETMAAEVPFV